MKMSMLDNKVKEIRLYKNAVVFNSNHNMSYNMKKYTEIEFDIESKTDITDSDYLKITNKGKLVKTLFKNELA